MSKVKWIENFIKALGYLDVDTRVELTTYTDKYFENQAIKVNEGQTLGISPFEIQVAVSQNCSKLGDRYTKCDLFTLLNEGKTVFKEFESVDDGSQRELKIQAIGQSTDSKLKAACPECYFRTRIVTLVDRLRHSTVEMNIPLGTLDQLVTMNLIGIKVKKNGKVFHTFLGVKYNNQEDKKITSLVSCQRKEVCFCEVGEEGILEKGRVVKDVQANEMEPVLFDVESLYYKDRASMLVNLYAKYGQEIDDSFKVVEDFSGDLREVVERKKNVKKKGDKAKAIDEGEKPEESVKEEKIDLWAFLKKYGLAGVVLGVLIGGVLILMLQIAKSGKKRVVKKKSSKMI